MYDIIKPNIDKNKYKYIELDNKLKVLIIFNKEADESAAALGVGVGSYNDPEDAQGLAHFLEHMLFMGTNKYPHENYFMNYVSSNGGNYNAFTSDEMTVYHYQIFNSYFIESLRIFSDFFIHPLLKEDAIQREINAVDSEFKKRESIEIIRKYGVLQELADKDHPFHKLGSGNKKSLQQNNIRDKLVQFYEKYYSANIMNLVILSNIDLLEMEKLITDLFSKIKNKDVIIPPLNKFPFNMKEKDNNKKSICMKLIKTVPITDTHDLTLIWQLPNYDKYYNNKPYNYILHLIGHEAEGSIFNFLKEIGMCQSLHASVLHEDNSVYLLTIDLELTEKGIVNLPNVIECIQSYINIIKKNNIDQWRYDENKKISDILFNQYLPLNKMDYVTLLVRNFSKFKPEDIIYGSFRYDDFNQKTKKLIKETFKYIDKNNLIILIASKIFDKIANKTEKWNQVKYINYNYPISLGEEFKKLNLDYELHLPVKNIYLPEKIIIDKSRFDNQHPIPIEHGKFDIWYKKDNIFGSPLIKCEITIYTNKIRDNINNYLLVNMYTKLIEYYLNSDMYYANLCLSGFSISVDYNYISIEFQGFKDKIEIIINKVINKLKNLKVIEKDFNFIKSVIKNELENDIYDEPYLIASNYINEKVYKTYYTSDELLNEIDKIYIDQINKPKKWLFDDCHLKIFIYGNINQTDTQEIIKYFKDFNSNKNFYHESQLIPLNNGDDHLYVKKSSNQIDQNNVIILFFEFDKLIRHQTPNWEKDLLYLSILNLHIADRFFSELRSKQQTGYVTKANKKTFSDLKEAIIGMAFLIQSPTYDPMDLKNKIKKFIKDTNEEIKTLTDKDFEKYKDTLKYQLESKFDTPEEEFSFMSGEIINGYHDFNIRDILIKFLKKITLDELLEIFNQKFINKTTRKIRMIAYYKN